MQSALYSFAPEMGQCFDCSSSTFLDLMPPIHNVSTEILKPTFSTHALFTIIYSRLIITNYILIEGHLHVNFT